MADSNIHVLRARAKADDAKAKLIVAGIATGIIIIIIFFYRITFSTRDCVVDRNNDETCKSVEDDAKSDDDDKSEDKPANSYSGTIESHKYEDIPYSNETVLDSNLDEGKTEVRQEGVNGQKEYTYQLTYKDGELVDEKIVSTKITREPASRIVAQGTRHVHVYTGYCSVEGYYRHRYASCTGDYSPQAKANAEAMARECNVNSYPVHGCYNTYR